MTAPIERVKLIIQTQDSNPKIRSGEVKRYTGIVNCFTRISAEQGIAAFWRGNLTNIIRYFPTQAFNLAFKDSIKAMFPKVDKKKEFALSFAINMASGGLAGAGSLLIVYPLDYARTRLASDVGKGEKQFKGLADCLTKTAAGPKGVMGLYNGFGVSVAGIIPYRGVYFGFFDTAMDNNPFKKSNDTLTRAASTFACAQFAAISAGYASYPFDTVRRRLQMQSEKPKVRPRVSCCCCRSFFFFCCCVCARLLLLCVRRAAPRARPRKRLFSPHPLPASLPLAGRVALQGHARLLPEGRPRGGPVGHVQGRRRQRAAHRWRRARARLLLGDHARRRHQPRQRRRRVNSPPARRPCFAEEGERATTPLLYSRPFTGVIISLHTLEE